MTITRAASMLAAALITGGCAFAPDRHTAPPPPAVGSFSASIPGGSLPRGWKPWTLSRFKKETQYELVQRDGRTVVRATAEGSASGLLHRLDLDPDTHPLLTWRWKVEALIDEADNTDASREDSPARVVVTFDGDFDKLALEDRLFSDLFRLATGHALPYATIMYIWENRLEEGTVIPSRHTSRIKMIVARSGRDGLGEWQEITRNIVEDYRRAFGEPPGTITSVAVMTDTDNTGASAKAYYGDIRFHDEALADGHGARRTVPSLGRQP